MLKLHVKRGDAWEPVFCYQAGKVLTCPSAPHKALPQRAMWADDDLAYFRARFANETFELRSITR